ncbi:MAG: Hsp20/alpha crystallin family protein [Tenuifilaceae bacterium]|nr:Hsp20/alpha crystallin family protein [Tenuifilaceae bacterium]
MTLLSISRPRAMRTPSARNEYSEFLNNFARTANGYNQSISRVPSVNIIEEPKNFLIRMAVPGYSKNDFSINIDKDVLTISANIENGREDVSYLVNEFAKTSFERRFNLGKSIDTTKIEASYKEGILEVTLTKREEAMEKPPRSISVS